MAYAGVGRSAYDKKVHLAIGARGPGGYDGSMLRRKFFRKWAPPCALAGIILLAILAGLALRSRSAAGASAEVVYAQPLRAVHPLPGPTGNTAAAGSSSRVSAANANRDFPPPGTARARIEVPVVFYDFGAVGGQDVVRRDFLVINRGSAPLVIFQAYTTCGCTTAELSASVIPPGKASRVTVIFDAAAHPAPGQTVRRGLVLETNDPDHPQAEIWVQARFER